MEMTKIPDEEFKTMVIRMLKNCRRKMDDLSKNLNKGIISNKMDIETIEKNQSELKRTLSEIKLMNSRLGEARDQISR